LIIQIIFVDGLSNSEHQARRTRPKICGFTNIISRPHTSKEGREGEGSGWEGGTDNGWEEAVWIL
jgi:hypothetical protein